MSDPLLILERSDTVIVNGIFMRVSAPLHQELVLLGGGHAHAAVLKRFGMEREPGVRLTLISDAALTPYSGMIPGYLAGRFTYEEAHLDLRRLARFAGGDFVEARATGLDLDRRRVLFSDRPDIRFDFLSVDTGSTPDVSEIPGAARLGIPIKPISSFLARWEAFEARILGEPRRPFHVVVAGAGAGGVEVALSLEWRLREQRGWSPEGGGVTFTLIGAGPEPMPNHNVRVRRAFARILRERGMRSIWNQKVAQAQEGCVVLHNGRQIDCDAAVFVTGASAPSWVAASGLKTDAHGFLEVGATLASTSHPFVFAAGDVAASKPYPRPKSGVFAVRQGPPLERNLRRVLRGEVVRPFRPQKSFLSLVCTGEPYAVASKGGLKLEGRWVWGWKERIDRKWMRGYQVLPDMSTMKPPRPSAERDSKGAAGDGMRCAGCGSKVSSEVLRTVLKRLASEGRVPLDWEPEDAAEIPATGGNSVWQTVDFLPIFINDPFLFGRIAAIHALNDLYAMGVVPSSAQVMAQVPYGALEVTSEALYQMLAGVADLFQEEGVALLGGHSSEAAMMGLGFVVNGMAAESQIWRKGGLRVGDALLLTQPLGAGLLFAADMRARAPGAQLKTALSTMQRSRRPVFEAVRGIAPSAVTDVTGFGLIGHALEMAQASAVSIRLRPKAAPVYPGSRELASAGIESSLASSNRSELLKVAPHHGLDPIEQALLVDPQTAGGFLVGGDPERLESLREALIAQGWEAAIVGDVVDGSEGAALSFVAED